MTVSPDVPVSPPVQNVPPTIWYKTQRVLRTIVQVGIPAFLAFALVLPQMIDALGLPVDSEVRLWLLAVAAGITGVAGAFVATPQREGLSP
jgi:hypothetical protein